MRPDGRGQRRELLSPASGVGGQSRRCAAERITLGRPVSDVATMDELVSQSLERPESLSLLVAAFALVALVLSVVGIYGVMGYYVQQHRKDIGIRMALSGSSADVLRLVMKRRHACRSGWRVRRRPLRRLA